MQGSCSANLKITEGKSKTSRLKEKSKILIKIVKILRKLMTEEINSFKNLHLVLYRKKT